MWPEEGREAVGGGGYGWEVEGRGREEEGGRGLRSRGRMPWEEGGRGGVKCTGGRSGAVHPNDQIEYEHRSRKKTSHAQMQPKMEFEMRISGSISKWSSKCIWARHI